MTEKKRKILFIEPVSDMGGVSNFIIKIIKFLPREKYEIHFASCGDGEVFNNLESHNVSVHRLPIDFSSIFSFRKSFLSLRSFLKNNDFDIIHSHTAKAGILTSLAKSGIDIKFVYTGHGWRYLQLKNIFKKSFIFLMEKIISSKADFITFASRKEMYEASFRKDYLPKSAVVYYSLDLDYLDNICKSNHDDIREKYKIPGNAYVVSFMGRITDQKDPETFARVIGELSKDIPNLFGLWIGGGDMEKNLKKYISDFSLNDKFLITGFLKSEDALSILSSSDVLLFTSKFEGLPISLLEGMGLGVPIVASSVGGIPEVIKDGQTGFLFNQGDYMKASEMVLKIYKDKSKIDLSSNGKEVIKKYFMPEANTSREFDNIYTKILNKNNKDYPAIGAFYQCYKRPKAFLEVITSFRKIYPKSKIIIVSDNGNDYSKIARKFDLDYSSNSERSSNGKQLSFNNRDQMIKWLTRLYDSITKISEGYVIILEDDVYVYKPVSDLYFDLNGINPYEQIGGKVTKFLKTRNTTIPENTKDFYFGGCGGAIIKRDFFVNNFKPDEFEKISKELESYIEGRYSNAYFSDYWLTLFILYYGGSIGQYDGFCEKWYRSFPIRKYILNDISVLHQEKKYYETELTEEESKIFGNDFKEI